MEQAPAAFSAIFSSLIEDIRDELNELKQSNTSLIRKAETLEAAQDASKAAITTLENALQESQAEVEQLKTTTCNITASVKEARKESKALQSRLDTFVGEQRNPSPKALESQKPTIEENDSEAPTARAGELVPYLSSDASQREPESSVTFCDTKQSRERRGKRKLLGVQDEALPMPKGLPAVQPEMSESMDRTAAPSVNATKRRKKTVPAGQSALDGEDETISRSELNTKTIPQKRTAAEPFTKLSSGTTSDGEAESNIIVAGPKDSDGISSPTESVSLSAYGRLAEEVIGDFDVSSSAQVESTASQKDNDDLSTTRHGKFANQGVDAVGKQPRRTTTRSELLAQFQPRTEPQSGFQVGEESSGGRQLRKNRTKKKLYPGESNWT